MSLFGFQKFFAKATADRSAFSLDQLQNLGELLSISIDGVYNLLEMQKQNSFLNKNWNIAQEVSSSEALFDLLLKNRELDSHEKIKSFISPSLSDLHDPFAMDGMGRVVERIFLAIKQGERIMVFGDFDTDGITSTVILVSALQELGADVSYRIPDRERDSHGLKDYLIDEIAEKGVKLIITCDCGVNEAREVSHAKSLGIDLIISDHHDPDPTRFPKDAVAVLNPHLSHCSYPDKNLSGSGIAFKIVSALAEGETAPSSFRNSLEKYLEINALGVIADCVPLVGENRILAKFGLEKIKNTQWDGLRELLESSDVDFQSINEETVGFHIAPRLNAASRIGDVKIASQLFLGNPKKNIERVVSLEKLNEMRRDLTESAFRTSANQVRKGGKLQFFTDRNWIPGILGLISGRYANNLDVPVIASRIYENGAVKASCRAPKGYSIISALRRCDHLLDGYGGHDGAAGFATKENCLEELRTLLTEYFNNFERPESEMGVEAFLPIDLLNFEVMEFLNQLAPFGVGNPIPVFGLKNVRVEEFSLMGKNKNHLRLKVNKFGKIIDFVGFFLGSLFDRLQEGEEVDVLFTLSENYWKGEKRLQLRIVDIRQLIIKN